MSACVSDDQTNSHLHVEGISNVKCYDQESNRSKATFCLHTQFFFLHIFENLSALNISSSLLHRLVNSSGMKLGMISSGNGREHPAF